MIVINRYYSNSINFTRYIENVETAMELAQQIYSIIEQSFDVQGQLGLKISSSIGVALYPDHPSSHTQLMKLADNVMYKVKNSGRNTVQFSQVRL